MNIIEWRDSLLESSLNYKAKYIGLILSQFYRRGKYTYPSIRTLSDLSGLTVNPVQDGVQILIDNNFIGRVKRRLSGDRYLSNIYTFNGVSETGHVSPGDTSPGDTSQYDTSNDTSNDTSPGDTEVDKEDKVEERGSLSIFKNKILNEEMKKFAEDKGVFGKQLETSWQRFLIKKGNAMIERNCSYEQFFADWQLWILNERIEDAPANGDAPLAGEDLKIQHLGSAAWRRKRDMTLNLDQKRFLESYEAENGEVWWTSLREFKQGRK